MSLRRVCDRSGTSDPTKLTEKYYFEYKLVKGVFGDEESPVVDVTNGTVVMEGRIDLCDECGVAVEAIVKEQIIGTTFVEAPTPKPAPAAPKKAAAKKAVEKPSEPGSNPPTGGSNVIPPPPKEIVVKIPLESTPEVKAAVAEIMNEVHETAAKAESKTVQEPDAEPAGEPVPEATDEVPEAKGVKPGKMVFGGVPGDDEEF
jgi:translation initiation factor IF-2